jgi:hypothetical protein
MYGGYNHIWIQDIHIYIHIYLKTELQRIGSPYFYQITKYAISSYCWPLRVLEVIFEPSRTIYDYFDPIDPP